MDNVDKLAIAAKEDKAIIPALWDAVAGFIRYQANRRYNILRAEGTARDEIDDYTQQGYFALLDAVEGFSPEHGAGFTTYLAFHLKAAFRDVEGIRTEKRDALQFADSLDMPLDDESGDTLLDIVADPDNPYQETEARIFTEQLRKALLKALDALPLVKREIIKARYFDGLQRAEIAQRQGRTISSIREQERTALQQLRREARKTGLDRFIELSTDYYNINGFRPVEKTAERRETLREQIDSTFCNIGR